MLSRSYSPKSKLVLLVVAVFCVPGALVLAQQDGAPFEWDHRFASPGSSLSAHVDQTMGGPPKGMVSISIKASGFSDTATTLALWQRTGDQFSKFNPGILADGTVQLIPGFDSMMLGGYLRGQSFDIALVDEVTNMRAHAKITPFPITAEGDGGCKASAEIQSKTGLVWVITLAGYDAGEQIETTSVAKKETLAFDIAASETGEIAFPVLYPKRSKGNALITAEGSRGCHVSLDFAIGKSALRAK